MKKHISGIAFEIPNNEEGDYIHLESNDSLSDFDIVIFSPNMESTYFERTTPYEGNTTYNKESSVEIQKQFNYWKKELNNFLLSGKTVFLILEEKCNFYIFTGTKSFSGTGKNRETTNHVKLCTNYDFLPFDFKISNAKGKFINPINPLIANFYNEFKDYIKYESYIEETNSQALLVSRNNDKVISSYSKIENGYLICLPKINFNIPSLIKENKKTEEQEWNPKALQLGRNFIQNILEIDKALRKDSTKTPRPEWIKQNFFQLEESEKIIKLMESNSKKLKEIEEKNRKLEESLLEQDSLKDLLFESGKNLENAVIKALEILGYSAENYDDGKLELDQIIISPEKIRYIGECEGKENKDIDIGKFRQLQDSLNEDFERVEIKEKAFGILFGNPHRLKAPIERGIGFTEKCIQGAKREKIGLILTSDLFNVCKYILESKNGDFKIKCRNAIHEQLGGIIKFPQIKTI